MQELHIDLPSMELQTIRFVLKRRIELTFVIDGMRLTLAVPAAAQAALADLVRTLPVTGDFLMTGHAMKSTTDVQQAIAWLATGDPGVMMQGGLADADRSRDTGQDKARGDNDVGRGRGG